LSFTYFDERGEANYKSVSISGLGNNNTFQNGLTEASNVVELGGPLIKNTTITLGAFNLALSGENLIFSTYSNTRDDSGSIAPLNFLYTNASGKLQSADIDFILNQISTNDIHWFSTDLTSSANRLHLLNHNFEIRGNTNGSFKFFNEVSAPTFAGANNNHFGENSLPAVTTGARNLGYGNNTLLSLTTGSDNIAIGQDALQAATLSNRNIAIGTRALYSAQTVGSNSTSDCIAIGFEAGYEMISSSGTGVNSQVVIGNYAFRDANATDTGVVVIGHNAARGGGLGVYIGSNAGAATNASGKANTIVGSEVARFCTQLLRNTIIGYRVAASNDLSLSRNTIIGYESLRQRTSGTVNDSIIIGHNAKNTATPVSYNSKLFIGNSEDTIIEGNLDFGLTIDGLKPLSLRLPGYGTGRTSDVSSLNLPTTKILVTDNATGDVKLYPLSSISGGGGSSCTNSFIGVTGVSYPWNTCSYSTIEYTLNSNASISLVDLNNGLSYAAILIQDATGGRLVTYVDTSVSPRTIVEVNDYDQSPNAKTIASLTVTPTHVYILYTSLNNVEIIENIRHSVIKSSTTIDSTLINASPSTKIIKGTNQYIVQPPKIASASLTGNETENVVYFVSELLTEPAKTAFTWVRNTGGTFLSGDIATLFTISTVGIYRVYKSNNILAGLFDGLTLGQLTLFAPNQVNITF
jgi:hypothetical protein